MFLLKLRLRIENVYEHVKQTFLSSLRLCKKDVYEHVKQRFTIVLNQPRKVWPAGLPITPQQPQRKSKLELHRLSRARVVLF